LKIKPKQVEKIVYVDVFTHDTIKVPVPAEITGPDRWKITDTGKCFKWSANAFKQGDSLKIQRTLFEYNNRTTEVYYRKRPHKFLFIHYGKWQYISEISSECGQPVQKTFNFIK
jgi:hypothetical protein